MLLTLPYSLGLLTENWFSISYELTYQNDTFNKMSDGKKAFVILKLLLEFSDKECPIGSKGNMIFYGSFK
jgi:hypothetical protein